LQFRFYQNKTLLSVAVISNNTRADTFLKKFLGGIFSSSRVLATHSAGLPIPKNKRKTYRPTYLWQAHSAWCV